MNFSHELRFLRPTVLALACVALGACQLPGQDDDPSKESAGSGIDGVDSAGDSGDNKTPKNKPDGTVEVPDAVLEDIVIEPTDALVRMNLGSKEKVEFKATGKFSDGEKKDITDKVKWKLGKSKYGEFKDSTLELEAQSDFTVDVIPVEVSYGEVIRFAQVTLAAYKKDGDQPDFLFVLPHKDKDGSKEASLRFSTAVPKLDVFFNVDTTMSMKEEIAELRSSLQNTIVPQVQKKVEDTQFGVGSFDDFPVLPHGRSEGGIVAKRNDQPFSLKQAITPDIARVQNAVNALKLGHGGDVPESNFESLYQISTGEGLTGPGATRVAARKNKGIGGVGFREGTMPVIVTITDAVSHIPGESDDDGCERDYNSSVSAVAHTRKQTLDALEKVCARVIYVASGGGKKSDSPEHCIPDTDGVALATATGARVFPAVWDKNRPAGCSPGQCCTGINGKGKAPEKDGRCSLVYNVDEDGRGMGSTIVSGIQSLAFYAQFDVTLEQKGEKESIQGDKLLDDRTTLDFIEAIEADKSGDPPLKGLPKPKASGDHFKGVTPGTQVEFKIRAFNDFLPEKEGKVQVFRAQIKVRADQCEGLELDTREVTIIVPPAPVAPPV